MTAGHALDVVQLVGRLIRSTYRATIVQVTNRSRRRRGLPEMDRYGRRCLVASTAIMGTFFALCAFVTVAMLTAEPRVHAAPQNSRPTSTRTYTPPVLPTSYAPPTPSFEPMPSAPPSDVEDADTSYVPLPDDDNDWDKPRICHRKWWC